MDISRVQFQSLRPMLRTKDLQATIEFYTWRLGFTCDG
jgi:catechol 2,3-dioxygenase-like lactoylglutathione lyase family enzyme